MTTIESDVPGMVWKVSVEVGATVEEGTLLVIVESMKMEVPITSSHAGTVTKVCVAEGDAVSTGQPLVEVDGAAK